MSRPQSAVSDQQLARVKENNVNMLNLDGRSRETALPETGRRKWRCGRWASRLGVLILLAGALVAAPPSGSYVARADSGGCVPQHHMMICTYYSVGSEQTFTIPSGVSTFQVTAVGAPGGDGLGYNTDPVDGGSCCDSAGGYGALVTATIQTPPGQAFLWVEVGGDSGDERGGSGDGYNYDTVDFGSGDGGGASDVRTCSAADSGANSCSTCPDPNNQPTCSSLQSRLVVAGGGGGGGGPEIDWDGAEASGGSGGNAGANADGSGQDGASGQDYSVYAQAGGGARGASPNGAGAGGAGGYGSNRSGNPGSAGNAGNGGDGGQYANDAGLAIGTGGGGGGGYLGGGGGGEGGMYFGDGQQTTCTTNSPCQGSGGGGGAGLSAVPYGVENSISTDTTGVPEVIISYTAPPATLYVNGDPAISNDSNTCYLLTNPCRTIGAAIDHAGAGSTINIAGPDTSFNGVYCEQLAVDVPLTLQASNPANPPIIDGGAPLPTNPSGTNSNPCAAVNHGPETPGHSIETVGDAGSTTMAVTLRGLTIQHGDASNNVTDGYDQPGYGGAVFLYPGVTLTIADSTIAGNTACSMSSCHGYGGAVYNNYGTLILTNSTISGNIGCTGSSCFGSGGGIYNDATTTVINSTISGNTGCTGSSCSGYGGGITTGSGLTLINGTVSGNQACAPSCSGFGGGIWDSGTAMLTNSILAGNGGASGSPDCSGTVGDANPGGTGAVGDNIIGDSTGCSGLSNQTHGDQVGPLNGSPIDPKLGPLQNNGGPTATMALLSDSPAIGKADVATCRLATLALAGSPPGPDNLDGRGVLRNADSRNLCDIGAYDMGPVTITTGWNLLTLAAVSTSTTSASGLVGLVNVQWPGAVRALAVNTSGAFQLYVAGYTPDLPLQPLQGIFLLSARSGAWQPTAPDYTYDGQSVLLLRGWNLVGAGYPPTGLDGSAISNELGAGASAWSGCGLQEVATYSGGTYQVHMPADTYHVPATAGMWLLCTKGYRWTPH